MTDAEFQKVWKNMQLWDRAKDKDKYNDPLLTEEFYRVFCKYDARRIQRCFDTWKERSSWHPTIADIKTVYNELYPPQLVEPTRPAKPEGVCEREENDRMEAAFQSLPAEEQQQIQQQVERDLLSKMKGMKKPPGILVKYYEWQFMKQHFVFVDGVPKRREQS